MKDKKDKFFEILTKSILYIENRYNGKVLSGSFDIKRYLDKYTSLKIESYRLFLDDIPVTTKDYFVIYKCYGCGDDKKILLKRFLTKNTFLCRNCTNRNETKINKQKDFWKTGISHKICKIKRSNKELIEYSNIMFNKENDIYKRSYYDGHLTLIEFEDIRHDIFSVDGIRLNSDIIFLEHIRINNQMIYSQFLYDELNDVLISLRNIKMICENCGALYSITRKLKEKILYKKSLCKKCYFSNRVFKVKNTININNEKITYQTKNEFKLIEFCNSNNILIQNGPVLQFIFNSKKRKYYIDFYIPFYKILIEMKDYHVWHKNQIKSGLWEIKEKCAVKYAKENGLDYKIIFSQDFDIFLNTFKI